MHTNRIRGHSCRAGAAFHKLRSLDSANNIHAQGTELQGPFKVAWRKVKVPHCRFIYREWKVRTFYEVFKVDDVAHAYRESKDPRGPVLQIPEILQRIRMLQCIFAMNGHDVSTKGWSNYLQSHKCSKIRDKDASLISMAAFYTINSKRAFRTWLNGSS